MTDKTCCPDVLAMASVPAQKWCEPYPWQTALSEGTIFPCLNLCFYKAPKDSCPLKPESSILCKKEESEREELMTRINSVSFALNDLTLYLDTHPDCPNGTALFHKLLKERLDLLADFATKFYPLTQLSMETGDTDNSCYGWSEGPMPWEGGCI